MNPLLKIIADPIEKHREIAIDIFIKLINRIKFDKLLISILLTAIFQRLNKIPFAEPSEELRINLINLLQSILDKYTEEFKPQLYELAKMISVLLTDQCPELKVKLSQFIINLTKKLKKDIGIYSKKILSSLSLNLKHQQNKIRKITLNSFTELILCDNAGEFLGDNLDALKVLINDRNYDVRKTFYADIAKMLKSFNIIYLRKYESHLVLFLLNGLSDEKDEIKAQVKEYIEYCGNNRKQLAIELGEDISKFNDL